jgi:integrase/recombinase XerD
VTEARADFAIEPDPGNVFLEPTGQVLNPDRLSRTVTKYIKQAAIGKGGSCHLFRHTVATLMLDNGADIRLSNRCWAMSASARPRSTPMSASSN